MSIEKLNPDELNSLVKQMIIDTFEAIIKLNTKAAELVLQSPTPDQILTHNKQLLNLMHIIYPVRDTVRKIIMAEMPEYEYLLDFVETSMKQIEEK
jgi:hypothetical protein